MSIDDMSFPPTSDLPEGHWRPVFFRPNLDTPERLVAAVVAEVDGEWHMIRASALERLKCLYGDEAAVALEAIEIGLDHVEDSLRAGKVPVDLTDTVSGLEIGEAIRAQAPDARELALRWIRLVSSLHNVRKEVSPDRDLMLATLNPVDVVERDISRDRLPVLVMSQMAERAPQTKSMFNPHVLRLERDQGARLLTHKAYIAFTGKRVAANFATLKPGRQKIAVDISKRLMWDLEQHRDAEHTLLPTQSHEMILYHPSKQDPTITSRQYDNVMEVVETLQHEGRNREIKVLPYESVSRIAEHILTVEGLAA